MVTDNPCDQPTKTFSFTPIIILQNRHVSSEIRDALFGVTMTIEGDETRHILHVYNSFRCMCTFLFHFQSIISEVLGVINPDMKSIAIYLLVATFASIDQFYPEDEWGQCHNCLRTRPWMLRFKQTYDKWRMSIRCPYLGCFCKLFSRFLHTPRSASLPWEPPSSGPRSAPITKITKLIKLMDIEVLMRQRLKRRCWQAYLFFPE